MNQADWKTKAGKLVLAFALASGYVESGSTLIGNSVFAQEAVTSKAATVEAAAIVLKGGTR